MSDSRPRDSFVSPRFAQPATFMRLPHRTDLTGVDVALFGVPCDSGATYRSGTRLGPREIRAQSSLIRPYSHFQKISPFDSLTIVDAGDVDVTPLSVELGYDQIERYVAGLCAAGITPVAVGGDHGITLPILRALAKRHGPIGLVQFDSHIDTWDTDFGCRFFHGSPFFYGIEEEHIDPKRFVQVGIRGPMYGANDFDYERGRGVTIIDIEQVRRLGIEVTIDSIRRVVGDGPTYVTFDIDAVDPAFAPGTGTPEVGGLTSHEAQTLVRGLGPLRLIGCDVVEVSPPFDGPGQITSLLAANLLFEMLCVIAKGRCK